MSEGRCSQGNAFGNPWEIGGTLERLGNISEQQAGTLTQEESGWTFRQSTPNQEFRNLDRIQQRNKSDPPTDTFFLVDTQAKTRCWMVSAY